MKSCVSRLPSHFTAKSSHKLKPTWLIDIVPASSLHTKLSNFGLMCTGIPILRCLYSYVIRLRIIKVAKQHNCGTQLTKGAAKL